MKKALACVISIIAVAVLITGCEQVHTHEFGEWDEVKAASCIEDGKRVRRCECGEAEEEIISATGHVEEVIAEKTATCTKSGLTEGVECSRCGKILVAQDSVAAIGHSYVYYVDENGEDYMLCTRDDCRVTVENAAGLYDEDNKLIASWDELFNNYGSKSFSDIYQNNADIQKGTKLVIDESVTGIAGYSFEKCYSLSEVYIPKTVSIIYECVFSECLGLKKIIVDESNEHFKSIDGNLYTKDGRSLIQYAIGKEDTEFTVPEGVTRIEYGALNYANSLKKINLPTSITYIAGGMLFGTKQAVEVNYVGTAEQWEKVSFPRNSWSNNMLIRYDETVRFVFLGFVSASSGGGAHYVKICDDEITVDCGSEIKYNATLGVDNLEIEYSDFVYEYAAEQGELTALEEIKNCEKWYVLEAEDETASTEKTMIICYSNGVHYLLSIAEGKSATGAYIVNRIYNAII